MELAEIAGKWHIMLTTEPADVAQEQGSPTAADAPNATFRIATDQPRLGRAPQQVAAQQRAWKRRRSV